MRTVVVLAEAAQEHGDECEFGQCFHDVLLSVGNGSSVGAASAAIWLFAHANRLHLSHRKPSGLSYKVLCPRLELVEGRFHSAPAPMKPKSNGEHVRVELGRHIVADSRICGGQPTFKGTRIMVWIILEQIERGMTLEAIAGEWDGQVKEDAIAEAISISDVVVKHEPFQGFHVGARRKRARRAAAVAAYEAHPLPHDW